MVAPGGGMRGCLGGHAWLLWGGGMRGCSGGVHGCSGGRHAWDTMRYGDTVNERAVRILLECILVGNIFDYKLIKRPRSGLINLKNTF